MKLSRLQKEGPPPVSVTISYEGKERIAGPFTAAFRVGRDDDCDVTLPINAVSRIHIEVIFENGDWWLIDQNSSNGTHLHGERVDRVRIEGTQTFQIASDGPLLRFSLTDGYHPKSVTIKQSPFIQQQDNRSDRSLEDIRAHYLSDDSDRPAGEHTMMIRKAFKNVQVEEKSSQRI